MTSAILVHIAAIELSAARDAFRCSQDSFSERAVIAKEQQGLTFLERLGRELRTERDDRSRRQVQAGLAEIERAPLQVAARMGGG